MTERVEIPSRKAGETRLSGVPKRGGALQRPMRVEIPSRKAGETRSGRASRRGGARKTDAGSRKG